jgi:hypothetical protein
VRRDEDLPGIITDRQNLIGLGFGEQAWEHISGTDTGNTLEMIVSSLRQEFRCVCPDAIPECFFVEIVKQLPKSQSAKIFGILLTIISFCPKKLKKFLLTCNPWRSLALYYKIYTLTLFNQVESTSSTLMEISFWGIILDLSIGLLDKR